MVMGVMRFVVCLLIHIDLQSIQRRIIVRSSRAALTQGDNGFIPSAKPVTHDPHDSAAPDTWPDRKAVRRRFRLDDRFIGASVVQVLAHITQAVANEVPRQP
jgi:hypothetical protein